MPAIKYLTVFCYFMTEDFKLILVSVLDVKFYNCYQSDINIATRLFKVLQTMLVPLIQDVTVRLANFDGNKLQ